MAITVKNLLVENAQNPVGVSTVNPRFSWIIESDEKNVRQEGYRITVTEWIATPVWDSGFIESDETINIEYEGQKLMRDTQYFVTVTVRVGGKDYTQNTTFRTGLLGYQAPNIGWIRPNVLEREYKFSPYFRREFALKSDEVAYATAYISARGWYELFINGKKPDEKEVLAPQTSPKFFLSYLQAYDITGMLKNGINAIGVQLGNGYSRQFRPGNAYHDGKRLWAFFSIVFTDGSYQHIWTDETWKWNYSPVIQDHIYDGEWYDARKELPGWNRPGFNDAGWQNAVRSRNSERLEPVFSEPVRILGSRPVSAINKIGENTYIYDFKYNGSGVLKIKVQGNPGAEIRMHHAECVFPDGTLQPWTNRNAEATDRYILKGDGVETYTPSFTYHCFRYVEITVIGEAEVLEAEALVYGSDIFNASHFECSNSMINRIQENFIRTLKTNFMTWPTDTGVRDERTPCSMDTQVYEEMAMHNCNIHNYFEKWLSRGVDESGRPDWSGDYIMLTWLMYKYYDDKRLVSTYYKDLRALSWAFYEVHKYNNFEKGFGDWSAPSATNEYEDSFSSVVEVNYEMWYFQMQMMKELAAVIHMEKDIPTYEKFAAIAKDYMTETFFDAGKKLYSDGKQTPNILALSSKMLGDDEKDAVLAALIRSIREKDNAHLDTGIFGTRYLIDALSKSQDGCNLVYEILNQTTYPSFGQQIVGRDATTAWEQWYNLQGMMTCSHSMFAGIGADFYKKFAGIETLEGAYKKILIHPTAPDELTYVNCKLETVRGNIEVNWRRDPEGRMKLFVSIPANCDAVVVLPNGERHEVQSGSYEF